MRSNGQAKTPRRKLAPDDALAYRWTKSVRTMKALKGARAQVVEPVEFQQTVQQIASTPLQSWTSQLDRKQPNVRGKEPAQQHPENCHFTIVEQLTHGLNPNTKIYFNIRGTPDWIIAAEVDL